MHEYSCIYVHFYAKMQEKPPFLAVFGHFFGLRWQVSVKE